jgi:hypothetical protein
MKKALALLAGGCFLTGTCMFAGCGGAETSVTKETTVHTPTGEKKITEEKKVETKGEHPPTTTPEPK